MRISVFTSESLRTVIGGVRGFPRDVQKQIRSRTKSVATAVWREEVGARPATRLENASLIRTATVAVRNNNVILQSGGKGSLRKAVPPKAVEFGADRGVITTYATRSPKGTPYRVKRHTQRQLPSFKKKGSIIYPAAAKAIPRIAALWVQTTIRTFHESIGR